MAQITPLNPHVRKSVLAYAQALRRRSIPYQHLVVFGSHAKGKATTASDIDVCVVGDQFSNDYHTALVSLLGAAIDVAENLDVVPYSSTDLTNRYDTLAKEIRTHGIKVV